jgi:hypothetical protein
LVEFLHIHEKKQHGRNTVWENLLGVKQAQIIDADYHLNECT